jgi:hypothetical protein
MWCWVDGMDMFWDEEGRVLGGWFLTLSFTLHASRFLLEVVEWRGKKRRVELGGVASRQLTS